MLRPTSAATRKEILDVAAGEFAQYGLSGARVERMAQKMAVTKRMIYYYFESKEALYKAVLEKSYRDIREHDSTSDSEVLDPVAAIRHMIEETLNHEISHPEFIRLVVNENIHHQASFWPRRPISGAATGSSSSGWTRFCSAAAPRGFFAPISTPSNFTS